MDPAVLSLASVGSKAACEVHAVSSVCGSVVAVLVGEGNTQDLPKFNALARCCHSKSQKPPVYNWFRNTGPQMPQFWCGIQKYTHSMFPLPSLMKILCTIKYAVLHTYCS